MNECITRSLDDATTSVSSLWALLSSTKLMPALVAVNLIIFFFLTTCLSVYETISTPLTKDEYKWEVKENSIAWTIIVFSLLIKELLYQGTVSAFGYFTLTRITKHHLISDLRILVSSIILLICGFVFMIDGFVCIFICVTYGLQRIGYHFGDLSWELS